MQSMRCHKHHWRNFVAWYSWIHTKWWMQMIGSVWIKCTSIHYFCHKRKMMDGMKQPTCTLAWHVFISEWWACKLYKQTLSLIMHSLFFVHGNNTFACFIHSLTHIATSAHTHRTFVNGISTAHDFVQV